jgi:hypothetical protein
MVTPFCPRRRAKGERQGFYIFVLALTASMPFRRFGVFCTCDLRWFKPRRLRDAYKGFLAIVHGSLPPAIEQGTKGPDQHRRASLGGLLTSPVYGRCSGRPIGASEAVAMLASWSSRQSVMIEAPGTGPDPKRPNLLDRDRLLLLYSSRSRTDKHQVRLL